MRVVPSVPILSVLLVHLVFLTAMGQAQNQVQASPPLPAACTPPAAVAPTCSYEAVNGDCTLVINRLMPITPPTIYMNRKKKITVILKNPAAIENPATLDVKSVTAQVPPDEFANGFTALTAALGSFTIALPNPPEEQPNPSPGPQPNAVSPPPKPPFERIKEEQAALADDMNNPLRPAKDALKLLHAALQPLPSSVCSDPQSVAALPWLDGNTWKNEIQTGLTTARDDFAPAGHNAYVDRIKVLDNEIQASAAQLTAQQLGALHDNQAKLKDALKTAQPVLDQLKLKLDALIKFITDFTPPQNVDQALTITDLNPTDKNYQVEVFNVDTTNKLTQIAKQVSGDKFVDDNSATLANLADVAKKTSVVTLTVQYETAPYFELSTGVLVPLTPYHSYTAAQTESASAPVVQQNKTYTVVPDASFNIRVSPEMIWGRQRAAIFITGAVGYTPATSSVALAVGPSFSWRSIVISPLADFGRDVQLTGGFTVGQPLGSSATPATAPLTKDVWVVQPAVGVSLRIPLGGATQ